MDQVNAFLTLISQSLLIIALPFVIAAAFQHFRVMTQQLRAKLSEEQQQAIDRAVGMGVKAAEQTGIMQSLLGPEKRKQAIDIAQSFLKERGINLDLTKIGTLVEAEVQNQFAKPSAIVDSAQTQQNLIDGAIQSGILAAEQSGLKGLIQNTAEQKKAYAIQMVTQYLSQYGIKIDPTLLNGLIESQLLKLVLQAKKQLPPAGTAPSG